MIETVKRRIMGDRFRTVYVTSRHGRGKDSRRRYYCVFELRDEICGAAKRKVDIGKLTKDNMIYPFRSYFLYKFFTLSYPTYRINVKKIKFLYRLRHEKNGGAWCPKAQISSAIREYLEIDLTKDHLITWTETQGRFGNGQGQEYAEAFFLEYWRDSKWHQYKNLKRDKVCLSINYINYFDSIIIVYISFPL